MWKGRSKTVASWRDGNTVILTRNLLYSLKTEVEKIFSMEEWSVGLDWKAGKA